MHKKQKITHWSCLAIFSLFLLTSANIFHCVFCYSELQFHNPKIFSATVHTAIKSKGAMKRNIAFRKFYQFSSSICPIHLRMNIFYKIHRFLVRFSAHFWSINCLEQKLGLTLQFSLSNHRNKWEKLEYIAKVICDIPFMIQSHAESMKKILGAL